MKNLFYITLCLIVFSCANEAKKIQEQKQTPPSEKSIKTPYKTGNILVKWSAYKHTGKIPVNGEFEKVEISNFNEDTDIKTAVSGTKFKIPISSINTNDKNRDYKIISSFFEIMLNTDTISGEIISLDSDGSGKISISMNNQSIEKNYTWVMDEQTQELIIKTSIDVLEWGAQNALNALNEVCSERHTGPDGVNKLWPDVDITVIAEL